MFTLRQMVGVILRVTSALPLFLSVAIAHADEIRISGVGLSTPLMQSLAEAYGKEYPNDSVSVILPPLGSTGAIRALGNGRLELAVAGRLLTAEEQAKTGKVVDLGRTAFGFASSDGKRVSGLTNADVADIYSGRLTHWDDGQPIRLIMRAERESDTGLIRQISGETDAAMDLAFKRKGLVTADNDLDTIKLLETVSGSFGPTTTGLARLSGSRINFLALNGVVPSAKALVEGRYPLSKPLYLVMALQPSSGSQRFAAFLQSARAREIMTAAEFVPMAR